MPTNFCQKFPYEFHPIRCKSIYNDSNDRRVHNRHQYSLINWHKYRHRNRFCSLKLFSICLLIISIIFAMYIGGVFIHLFETEFNEDTFHYPLFIKDFRYFIEQVKQQPNLLENALKPINDYSYFYHMNPTHKCQINRDYNQADNSTFSYLNTPITLLLIVKSATCNYLQRNVIRQTWGNEHRFSDVQIRTVFMLGECPSQEFDCVNTFNHYRGIEFSKKSQRFRSIFAMNQTLNCHQLLSIENDFFGDLVQANFIDSYYNNTKKTMASLQWVAMNCNQVPFILFVDDDYYISVKNLLKFTHNYLHFIQKSNQIINQNNDLNLNDDSNNEDQDYDFDDNDHHQSFDRFDGRLYVGYLFSHSHPLRHLTSKWYISLNDYQWDQYPPYITGGCFLVNNQTIIDLYYSSLYSQPFKYDDVYLGILAYRMKIQLIDNRRQMHFYPLAYDSKIYSNIIGSHGFHDSQLLWQIWNEQKSLGNA